MSRLLLRRSPIIITALIILGVSLVSVAGLLASNVVMGGGKLRQSSNPAALQQDITRRCEESQRWDEPKPGYDRIDQSAEGPGFTIRLVQGKFTDTSTTLEFLIEYPFEEGAPDLPARFRLWDVSNTVQGIASVSEARFSSTWGCGGRLLAVLEGLGPVSDPQQGFSIQIPKVLKRTEPPPGASGEVGWETIQGPWTFQVAPMKAAGVSRTITVNQSLEQGGITLKLVKVVLGLDETVVYYDEVVSPPVLASRLAPARIRYSGGAWVEGSGGGSPSQEGQPKTYRFPALPPAIGALELDFRSFIASTESALELAIDIPPERGAPLPLDQEIQTTEGTFKAVSLSIEDTGFGITLEPVDDKARHIMLRPGSSFKQAQATDDLGNIYSYDGGASDIVEGDNVTLGSREVYFRGQLSPEATKLTLRFEHVGKVQPGPWVFTVQLPPEELVP